VEQNPPEVGGRNEGWSSVGLTHWTQQTTTRTHSDTGTTGSSSSLTKDLARARTDETSSSNASGNDTTVGETLIANPNYISVDQVNIAAAKAENDFIDANLKAQEADIRASETLEKLKMAQDSLNKHQQLVAEETSALTVKAGANGKLSLLVVEGLFVKKGHVLGTIAI
jgi:hypothetical protein